MIIRWKLQVDDGPWWGYGLDIEAEPKSRAAALIGRLIQEMIEREGGFEASARVSANRDRWISLTEEQQIEALAEFARHERGSVDAA